MFPGLGHNEADSFGPFVRGCAFASHLAAFTEGRPGFGDGKKVGGGRGIGARRDLL